MSNAVQPLPRDPNVVNRAYTTMAFSLLGKFMGLPTNWKILGVFPMNASNYGADVVQIVVEGEGLPEIENGEMLEEVVLFFQTDDYGVPRLKLVKGDEHHYEVLHESDT